MPLSSTLIKANIIDTVAERKGFTRKKSIETVEIILELIKHSLESGDDVLISGFGKLCVKKKKRIHIIERNTSPSKRNKPFKKRKSCPSSSEQTA